jgi:hypothetical protein
VGAISSWLKDWYQISSSRSGDARADARIYEIEEEHSDQTIRRLAGKRLHRGPADVVADHADLSDVERTE